MSVPGQGVIRPPIVYAVTCPTDGDDAGGMYVAVTDCWGSSTNLDTPDMSKIYSNLVDGPHDPINWSLAVNDPLILRLTS